MKIIELYWNPPIKLAIDLNVPCYKIPENQEIWDKSGCYQIYADHPVYGRDSLIYIGITNSSFRERFNSHLKDFIGYHVNISVRHCLKCEIELQGKTLEEIEALLISAHMPALNKEYLHSPKTPKNDFLVLNLSESGALMPVVSTALFAK